MLELLDIYQAKLVQSITMAADPLTAATVDNLLNFDSTDDEDPFNDKPSRRNDRDDKPTLSPRGASKRKAGDDTLGLDSEVKIKKARKPIAKLDEARLLSAPGLPKLRADARKSSFLTKKLRIKGRGHEFSDVAKLLNYYQLWLDDLYPRAKFADGLQLVEKAGHSRRMGVMRKEWIDEGKPDYIREREARKKADKEEREREKETDEMYAGDAMMSGANNEPTNDAAIDDDALFVPDSRRRDNAVEDDAGLPADDELDALLAEQDTRPISRPSTAPKRIVEDDSEGEDDLDALLAQQQSRHKAEVPAASASLNQSKTSPFDEDEDMDDLEALLAEQETRSKTDTSHKETTQSKAFPHRIEEEFPIEEDDDLEALLAEQETREPLHNQPALPKSTAAHSSTPVDEQPQDMEEDGADMFSSSPVRGTASSRFVPDGEDGAESSGQQSTNVHDTDEDQLKDIQGSKEEESQGLDAGDMFSSSPLQVE